jgi:predicted esterase
MKSRLIKSLLFGLLISLASSLASREARGQQVPYLAELLARYAAFNQLYAAKKQAGADLSSIEPVRARAEAAFQKGDIPSVIEAISQGIWLLEGQKWDDAARFMSSLTVETDRLVLDGSQPLGVSLDRMYPVDESKSLPQGVKVTFLAVPGAGTKPSASAGSEVVIARDMGVSQASTTVTTPARRLPLLNGPYYVVAVIQAGSAASTQEGILGGGKQLARIQTPVYAISDFTDRISRLSGMVTTIKASSDPNMRAVAAQISTPEFQLARLAGLTKSNGSPGLNPIAELEHLEIILPAMATGANPLATERGEVERAYSTADGQLVPYRVFVPSTYDGSRSMPLVVALHGALGDEKSYFSGIYDPAVIKGEAERRGYIVATPTWLGRFPYGAPAEEDVLRVISEVRSNYKIDPSRIYLTGHSLGGFGAWQIAFDHPEIFAGLAPVSGGSPVRPDALPPLLARIKNIPVLVVHGAKDGIVPPARSKEMVEAARKAGVQISYTEVPGADHLTVVGSTFPAVLEFFDKHIKQ